MNEQVPPEVQRLLALCPLGLQGLSELLQELGADMLCRAAWKTRNFVGGLSETDLVHLVKAYVFLEELAPRAFCAGSTTQVPQLLTVLGAINRELSRELTVWAFHTTSNSYVPYGTVNSSRDVARTTEEYTRLEAGRTARRENLHERAQAEALARREARSLAHFERVSGHAIGNADRARRIALLLVQPPVDRLVHLCQNQDLSPGFFPPEVVVTAAIGQLTADQQKSLLEWLRHAPRGPWRRVRSAATALVHARAVADLGS